MKRFCRPCLSAEKALWRQLSNHRHSVLAASRWYSSHDSAAAAAATSPTRTEGADSNPDSNPSLRGEPAPYASSRRPNGWTPADFTTIPKIAPRVLRVLRHMPSSVVVVTASPAAAAAVPGGGGGGGGEVEPVGMTVSSFQSLDISDDRAKITFNVQRPSMTLEAIESGTGVFHVHVLRADEEGASVARHFRRPNRHGRAVAAGKRMGNTEGEGEEGGAAGPGLFDDLPASCGCILAGPAAAEPASSSPSLSSSPSPVPDPPRLRGPGVLYVLRCVVPEPRGRMLLDVGRHTIVVAGVTDVFPGDGAGPPPRGVLGLAYADQRYRGPGGVLRE